MGALAPSRLLTERFIKDLHGRMLGDVWRWAGELRTSERNLGIPYYEIPTALRDLVNDVKAWVEHKTYHPAKFASATSRR